MVAVRNGGQSLPECWLQMLVVIHAFSATKLVI